VDTSELFQRSELVAQIAQVCTTSWVQAVISDRSSKRKRYLIREEGWRDMTSVQALQTYQQWLKLSRHYGIANVVILHKMGDLDAVGPEGSQERSLARTRWCRTSRTSSSSTSTGRRRTTCGCV
jgi:hypothetical protein